MTNKKDSKDKLTDRKDKLFVFKIGGSAFDLIREEKDKEHLIKVFEELVNVYEIGYKMVLTCGAGPWGDASKDFARYFKEFGLEEKADMDDVRISCAYAAGVINKILVRKNKADSVSYCRLEKPDFLGHIAANFNILKFKIPVLACAPETVQADYKMVNAEFSSDAHSIMIADWLGQRYPAGVELIFIKNTKGIYPKDPNRTDIDPKENKRIKEIHIDNFLNNSIIDRTGTDKRGEHLLETVAGQLFKDVKNLSTVRIITTKEPGRIIHTLNGENRGSIIYNNKYRVS